MGGESAGYGDWDARGEVDATVQSCGMAMPFSEMDIQWEDTEGEG